MYIALIILVNLLFYLKTLKYQGICDDIPVFAQNIKIPGGLWMKFWYHWHGRKYTSYKLAHAITISIHTINCILIYIAFGMNYTSLLASLLFAVNPVNNQGSMWISGKGYSTNTMCALLMWMFPYFSIIPYCFGTYFCGPSLVFFPLVFLFTKYWYLSFLVIIGLLREKDRIFNKKDPASKFNTESNKELLSVKPRKLIIALKSYGYYFINALSARILGFYHNYLFLHGVCEAENKKSYIIDRYFFIGIFLAGAVLYTRDIGLVWFTIVIAQWCNFISFNQTISNRYIYLGNVGLMYLVARILINFPILLGALLAYYITKLIFFTVFYKNEYWSIEYACIEQPDFFYEWQNRAVYCFHNKNYHGAIGNLNKANELRPKDWKVLYNTSQIYLLLGNMNSAKKYYEEATQCTIDGREEIINKLNKRLKSWIDEIENQAKTNNNQVQIDLGKFDLQR